VIVMSASAHAAVVNVSTPAELTAAIQAATPGTEIVLADGTYALTGVTCAAMGTELEPIIVRAATPLGALIDFDGLEGFKVNGANWHFEGLDIKGVCAADSDCEHAFHVSGTAEGFVLRFSRVRDFNAQLKVNASMIDTTWVMPHRGLVEYNEIGDTHPRATSNPTTKLNIDTGDDWIVRGNYIHDAQKMGGDNVSYAAFMKSGGKRGLFERNLVLCSKDSTGGTRIGLSFGGGGTAPQFCAPAFDAGTPCSVEHEGGTMRNNIIANCSDVGIYLNRGKSSHILYNTIIGTGGVDFRFATTSGEAVGNVLTSMIRTRDTATMTKTDNMEGVAVATFQMWYADPLAGNLMVSGDVSGLVGKGPARPDVTNDYCAQARPTSGLLSLGAIEHSIGSCETTTPPVDQDPDPPPVAGDDIAVNGDTTVAPGGGGGCCQTQDASPPASLVLVGLVALVMLRRRVSAAEQARPR
jgi:MYXO-CTERM domain-containing protein